MTASNHVFTGAFIGLSVHQPVLAVALAIASHFVLDTIPHFGDKSRWTKRTSHLFKIILAADATIVATIFTVIAIIQPAYWQLAVACAFAAAAPDFMWLPHYIKDLRGVPPRAYNKIEHFHSRIQTERAWGIGIEVIWASIITIAMAKLI